MENYEYSNEGKVNEVATQGIKNKAVIASGAVVMILLLIGSFFAGTKYRSAPQNIQHQVSSETHETLQNEYEETAPRDRTISTANELTSTKNLFDTFFVLNVNDGVISSENITISWQVSDEVISQFPADETYIVFELFDKNTGRKAANIGDGFLFSKNTYTDTITDLVRDNRIVSGAEYTVRASLRVQPSDFQCNSHVQGECAPIYSSSDTALIDNAKRLSFESEPFTFSDMLWQDINEPSSVSISGPLEISAGGKATWTGTVSNDGSNPVDVNCRVSRWQTGPDRFGNDFSYSDWNEKIFDGSASNGDSFTLEWTATKTSEGDAYFEISCTPWEENSSFAGNSGSLKFEVI